MASGINLFVAQLDKNIDDEILRKEFSKFGELFRASVAKDESGISRGYGFVHFVSMNDGVRAMKEMNGKTFLSREIHVDIANSQETRCYGPRESIWVNELDTSAAQECESNFDASSVISDYPDEPNRSDASDIKERMKKLFNTQMYADVTFYPKNSRKVSISAHRAVLAIGSPLFTTMLFGGDNKGSEGMKMDVEISNLSFDAFTNIVKYLYTDEVFFESDSQVQDILQGAQQFVIPSLVARCNRHFETLPLTSDNVCSKLQLSISNKIGVLKDRCVEFIQNNTHQVINASDFQNCSPTTVRTICNLQSLNLRSETDLLRAVMSWLQYQPHQNRKQVIQSLLKCFRFLTFTVGDFGESLKTYPDLLTSEEGLKIMLYLYNPPNPPDFTALPPWCNKNTRSRCFFAENRPGSTLGINRLHLNDAPVGRIAFPLRSSNEQNPVTTLTSLLQLKCVSGMHQLKAIKLSFQPPVSDRSMIGNLTINVHVHPSRFRTTERIQIGNSETVRVEFSKAIKVRTGDLVDIEADAKDIRSYRFLQFDETGRMPHNPHFQCCVLSRPKEGKMYFISELEYGPQEYDRVARPIRRPRKK